MIYIKGKDGIVEISGAVEEVAAEVGFVLECIYDKVRQDKGLSHDAATSFLHLVVNRAIEKLDMEKEKE